jgi:hypothetical protein
VASLSQEDIQYAVQMKMEYDPQFRAELIYAVQTKNEGWIARLVKWVMGELIGEVARSVIHHIFHFFTGW